MRFVAIFFDDLQPAAVEPELTRAHFDYLARIGDRLRDAGGMRAHPEAPFCGSLWVIEAEDADEARRLVAADPYCLAGLRPGYRVLQWNKAPGIKSAPQQGEGQ